MNKNEAYKKRLEFEKLYVTGKYSQKEIAKRIGLSEPVRELPITKYSKIRANLCAGLERLSQNPSGKEDLVFQYIDKINLLDTMIRKAKFLPKL
jgi:hypothetical protein